MLRGWSMAKDQRVCDVSELLSQSPRRPRQSVKLQSHQEDHPSKPFQGAWQPAPISPALQTEPRGNKGHGRGQHAQVFFLRLKTVTVLNWAFPQLF